jgi:hypothetical protein
MVREESTKNNPFFLGVALLVSTEGVAWRSLLSLGKGPLTPKAHGAPLPRKTKAHIHLWLLEVLREAHGLLA